MIVCHATSVLLLQAGVVVNLFTIMGGLRRLYFDLMMKNATEYGTHVIYRERKMSSEGDFCIKTVAILE